MTGRVDYGFPILLEFRGPDAVRYLNGQLTQDVRRVVGSDLCLHSCVTDAKGRLQFRVTVMQRDDVRFWICALGGDKDALNSRLTRYLIADDVEVEDLTGSFKMWHFIGEREDAPEGVISREANRFGVLGRDWWVPSNAGISKPNAVPNLDAEELEDFRIRNSIPAWGTELKEGMLPPEALLEETDISYRKGCYIGQEVISRIKSAGKVNKRLTRFEFDENVPVAPGLFEDGAGEITSVSPRLFQGVRYGLGYVKRGAERFSYKATDGIVYPVRLA